MKAIETIYNGIKYRSRLEARWAKVFDTIGVPYHYEMEGFDFGESQYLPDFWLPTKNVYVEIKGTQPAYDTEAERKSDDFVKCMLLAQRSRRSVLWLYGPIPSMDYKPYNLGVEDVGDFYRMKLQGADWLEVTPNCYPGEESWEGVRPVWDGNDHVWLYSGPALNAGRAERFGVH